ncbi:hypothetical protein ACFSKL_16140 [Belliella marina]|uniref:DUF3786 domain-containing protein n=1 Tax=Belliella marina TaxID=1644146 RepID=A0ABW4VRW8_9BACT
MTKAFKVECDKLVGHVLTNVYYEFGVEGFLNTRELNEVRFEYIPLSLLYFEMQSGSVFTFFDSTKFLEEFHFYTLDMRIESNLDFQLKQWDQSKYFVWSKYLNKEIKSVEIIWGSLYKNHFRGNPPDIYPRGLEITFSEDLSLVIVASEFDMVKDRYSFMCPDEALIVCFSREIYESLFGKEC